MTSHNQDHILTEEDFKRMPQYNPELPPLSGEILGLFKPHQPRWTFRDIQRRSHACRGTLKKRLGELLRAGLLRKHGKGRATWYTL